MHELSIASAVLSTALRHAEGRPVTLVSVRAGRMRAVAADSLRFYFEIVARDTLCAGARLEVAQIELALRCGECAQQWEPGLPDFRCPACGSAEVEVLGGEELVGDYIEVDP